MAAITSQLQGASTVLVEEPSMGGDRSVCTSLLTVASAPSVLFVSYTRQPGECLAQIEDADAEVGTVGVITVGDTAGALDRDDVVTENVSGPSDLTGLGIEIGRFLSDAEAPVAVCVDSLTSMLQYVDFETAFEFLHTVTGQIHAADAQAHVHIDPNAHDDQHVAALTSLFDASVSVGEETQVRTREIIQ